MRFHSPSEDDPTVKLIPLILIAALSGCAAVAPSGAVSKVYAANYIGDGPAIQIP